MSFGKIIPDSVQLHYSLSTASVQLRHSLNSYRSLYPQEGGGVKPTVVKISKREYDRIHPELGGNGKPEGQTMADKMLLKRHEAGLYIFELLQNRSGNENHEWHQKRTQSKILIFHTYVILLSEIVHSPKSGGPSASANARRR